MAFRLLPDESVQAGVRRIAREQIDNAIDDIDDGDVDVHETVHEVRKRCKKIRGLIRLVRPAFGDYSAENTSFRDAARKLSDVRDATTLIECHDALMKRYAGQVDGDAYAGVREKLCARRDEAAKANDLDKRIDEFREAMKAGRARTKSWKLDEKGYAAIAGGLKKTYRRGRQAMSTACAAPGVETFHAWRKRVKYHRYHLRLLREVWAPVMGPLRDEVKRLSDLLGDDHDLAVYREVLVSDEDRFGPPRDLQTLLALIDQRRQELQAWAHPLGQRVYADKPKTCAARIGRAWQAQRAERDLAAALADESGEVFS